MGNIIIQTKQHLQNAKNDFFTPFMLKLAILPLVISLLFWAIIFYFFGDNLFLELYDFIRPDLAIETSWLSWIQSLLDFIIKATLFIVLFVSFLVLSLLSNLIICSFLTPLVVNFIHKRHYQNIQIAPDTSLFSSILSLVWIYLVYGFFLLILIPFYFIPFVGTLFVLLLLAIFKNALSRCRRKYFQKNRI